MEFKNFIVLFLSFYNYANEIFKSSYLFSEKIYNLNYCIYFRNNLIFLKIYYIIIKVYIHAFDNF